MIILSQEPKKTMDESFMMNFFNPLIEQLQPFKEHLDCYYNHKKTHKVVRDNIKYQPLLVAKNELFNPTDPINAETDHVMHDIGIILAENLFKELRDETKATCKHLSTNNGVCYCNRIIEVEKEAGKGLFVNNNASESAFGGLTNQVNTYSMIGINNAG